MENYIIWEYKVLKFSVNHGIMGGKFNESELNLKLNELGEQRWELVTSSVTNQGYGSSRDIVAIFKRPKR